MIGKDNAGTRKAKESTVQLCTATGELFVPPRTGYEPGHAELEVDGGILHAECAKVDQSIDSNLDGFHGRVHDVQMEQEDTDPSPLIALIFPYVYEEIAQAGSNICSPKGTALSPPLIVKDRISTDGWTEARRTLAAALSTP